VAPHALVRTVPMRPILPRATHARAWLTVYALVFLMCAALRAQPSRHIRIAVGAVGAGFYETALQYKALLEPKGYRVDIVSFANTDEIEARVADDRAHLDLGFVSGNHEKVAGTPKLISLGDVQLQPIFIFENRATALTHPVRTFSDLRGLSLVLPPPNSLTSDTMRRVFALAGIDANNTRMTFLPFQDGVARLKQGQFDAGIFILAANSGLANSLAKDDRLVMVEIEQQGAIAAQIPYLSEVKLPAGIYDVAHNVPPRTTRLLAATISVVARRDLPPATAYAVLDAMRDVHRQRTYVNDAGTFPRYLGDSGRHESLVDDFYRHGTPWIYSHLPIAVASVVDAYLGPLLALWVAMSALGVLFEFERTRELMQLALAEAALWRLRRARRNGAPPPAYALALARRLADRLAPEAERVERVHAALRQAIER
jgi:TRAP-type uncharacterized transport system substrate-binding protein